MHTNDDLLERRALLASLQTALLDARRGHGRVVVVVGEAGVGKTTLLRAAAHAAHAAHPRLTWLQAGCDPLHTPRTLGPLLDLGRHWPASLAQALHQGHTYNGLFPRLLDWLATAGQPTVLVLEDLHWADDATLDAVRYLGRRLGPHPVALVLSVRPDALDTSPALRQTLVALDSAGGERLSVLPLSPGAVAEAAHRQGWPADGLHARTGGNPFYLAQLLQTTPGSALPASLSDSVLARLDGLGADTRQALDVLSTCPSGLELQVLQQLLPDGLRALGHPAAQAFVQVTPPWVALRHDLLREVLEQALAPVQRWHWHRELALTLSRQPDSGATLARRLHHAAAAGLADEVRAWAPQAAQQAADVAAHRSAVRWLELALAHTPADDLASRGDLLDRLASSCHSIHAIEQATQAREQAMAIHAQAGQAQALARSQALLALQLTPAPRAVALAREAVDALAGLPAGPGVALAAGALAICLANQGRAADALAHAVRARSAAAAEPDVQTRLYAETIAASVELSLSPSDEAFQRLTACIDQAMALGLPQRVVVPLVNLCSVALVHADYARVIDVSDRGIRYCVDRDMDMALAHLYVRRALALVELARWPDAAAALDALQQLPSVAPRQLASARILRSRMQGLCNTPADELTWQAHVNLARAGQTDLLPNYVVTAAAEAAWLRGDQAQAVQWAALGLADAEGPWVLGHLRAWLRHCQHQPPGNGPQALSPPHHLEEAGQWQAAAQAWAQRGCVVQQALALLAGDGDAGRQAVHLLNRCAAHGVARRVRQVLAAQGVGGVNRGPYGHRRADPLGLTRRERQVAELLARGLSNRDIALELHRSEHTVAHHVSGVLGKLGLTARSEVAARLQAEAGAPAPGRATLKPGAGA